MGANEKSKYMQQQAISRLSNGIEDYDSNELAEFMDSYNRVRKEIMLEKDAQYGGSWQDDGLLGAFLNYKRKLDRIINMFKNGNLWNFNEEIGGETIVDTFLDASNYNTMFLFLLSKKTQNTDNNPLLSRVLKLGLSAEPVVHVAAEEIVDKIKSLILENRTDSSRLIEISSYIESL